MFLRSFALCCFLMLGKPWASSGVQFGFPHPAGRAGLLPLEERKECRGRLCLTGRWFCQNAQGWASEPSSPRTTINEEKLDSDVGNTVRGGVGMKQINHERP